MLAPVGAKTFSQAIRWCSEIFFNLKELLKSNNYSTSVGDEGGFAPNFKSNFEPLEFLIKAIKRSKLRPERCNDISDVASSEFYKKINIIWVHLKNTLVVKKWFHSLQIL